ncbi:hypothetical protein PMAYCL1PPCAC_03015, partial [Pristionchus mayeri]
YEEDEVDSYYRPSVHSASPRVNLAALPDSSFIDYDLGDDREDPLYDYDPFDPLRSPSPVHHYTPSPLGARSAVSRRYSAASTVEREVPEFDAATTSRDHFTWKDPKRPEKVSSSTPSEQTIPFYAETTNRQTYTWKDPEKRNKRASPY